MNVHFEQPSFFWMALAAVPLLAGFFFWSWRVKQQLIKQFVPSRLLGSLMVGFSPAREQLRMALLSAAVVAALLALARPQWGFVWEEVHQKGLDVLVAIDTSRSMLAQDVPPNRLGKAKLAAFDLMREAQSDRLGLIAFAGSAFLQSPLTIDDEIFRQNVQSLNVGIIPQGGTALSEAIRTAIRAFEKDEDNHRVLVLFTDGEDHDADEDTLGAAQQAAKDGIKIFTVGVGTAEGELLRVPDEQGNPSFLKDDDGNVVKSHLNEGLLEKIATVTGGFYLPLRGADPMKTLYERGLAPLPRAESTTKLTRAYKERFHWPLGFAILCLVAEVLLPERKRERASKKSPAASPASARASELQTVAAIVCLLLLAPKLLASPSSAFRDFQSGDYQDSYDEYKRLLEQKTNDYRLQYDAGTAAYGAKQLEAAEKHLQAALSSPQISSDLQAQERAYYNLGNTLYRLGEPSEEADKKKERWEKSVENYAHALQLNTNDIDAKNNLAFVKRQLEELKRQQQQQQQQKKQDQKDQKDQKNQKQDQKQQDQDKQQQQQGGKQDKDKDKDKQQGQQDQKKQDEQQKQTQAKKADKDKEKADQAKAAAGDQRDKQPDQDQQPQPAGAMAQMTPQQARQLLDAQRDYEKALPLSLETNSPVKPQPGKFKDW